MERDVTPPWYDDEDVVAGVLRDGLVRENAPPPRIPGCEDLQEIGRGGQGVVYSARQTAMRRRVAVKVLLDAPGKTRAARLRFDRELEIVASLRDPRLVQVFAGGAAEDGRPFVVMELVQGVALDQAAAVRDARALGFARPGADRAIALFAEICAGMDHAHRHGVIHRDLKPSNIFVDPAGTPRVLDFGLAKASGLAAEGVGFATTAGAHFVGSLPWSSPEQAEGRTDAIDVRSDVYALGATLYHVVTGRPPCPLDLDLRRTLEAIVNQPPQPPSNIEPRCDRDLEAVILRALEKDPGRRYATAGDMERDLRRLLAGEPIEARRETAWRALVKLARRRRRVAILSGILAIAAVAVVVLTSWLWQRAASESKRAAGALDFFLDSIGMVDPARGGADTPLADALDRVSADLDRRFGDSDQAVRLNFRMRLRDLYFRLGRYDKSLAEAEAVSAMTRAADAQPPSNEFRSRWNGETTRALLLYRKKRLEEALAIYREAHAALSGAYGVRDSDSLQSLASSAQVLKALGRTPEAEAALRGVVAATEGASTVEDGALARATALDNLAALSEIGGRPADAEAPQREATRLFASLKGENAQETLTARSNLANLLLTLGRPQDAIEIFVPTVAVLRDKSGPKNPMTLAASHNLGVAFLRAGRAPEGEQLLKHVYETRIETLGPAAHDTLLTLNELAVAAGQRGDGKENERLLRLLVEGRKKLTETPPTSYWNALNNLAGVIRDSGRPEEALAIYDELVPAARLSLKEDHWLLAWFVGNRARCLTDLERYDEAASQLSASETILTARLGAKHENTVGMRSNIERNDRKRAESATRPTSRNGHSSK